MFTGRRAGWLRIGATCLLALAIAAAGCKKKPPPVAPPEVLVLTVTPTNVPIFEDWIGTLDGFVNAQIHAQVTGYLLKQTPREELLSALGDVHRGGSPMTSNIARKVVQSFKRTRVPVSPGEELSLELLARGYLYKEIAERLNISVPTVNTYIRRMYEKLHVRSRAQAVAKYAHLSNSEERQHLPGRP